MAKSRRLRLGAVVISLLLGLALWKPVPAGAIYHLAVIDEVMTSYGGDPSVQFVEVRMLAVFQLFVANTVIAAFGADGAYLGDVLVLPTNVVNHGADVPWLMGTSAFAAVSGLTPDIVIPPSLPTGGGMVCWGAPGNGLSVPNPASWDHSNPDNYTDCLAYGSYSGPSNHFIGTPTGQTADGHSLQRVSETHDNATDFECTATAMPANNASETVSLPATAACAVCGNGSTEAPSEECDGADAAACPGQCQANCTCAAVCGDDEAEAPEACDGSDDAACPGGCQGDCTCPTVLDSFKCYAAKDLKDPKFSGANVALADQLGVNDGDFEVQKPAFVCPPVNVDGEGILQPDGQLTCYKIKGPKLEPADRPALAVEDRFGPLGLEASKPTLLCVPPTEAGAVILDPFKCYAAKDLKDPKFAGASVSLADALGVNDGDFAVQKPAMFCTPASVNGEDILQPKGQLTCYKIKGPKLDAADRPTVEVTDRFGSLRLEASKAGFLCVPPLRDLYVAASGALNGDGSSSSPYRRITDAVARARAGRASGAVPPEEEIRIHVAPGTYVGSFDATELQNNPEYEVLPIILNVPRLAVLGATVLVRDDRGLPTGAEPESETILEPDPPLVPDQSLFLVTRTADGAVGNRVTVEGFVLDAGEGGGQRYTHSVFVDRVSDFRISNNLTRRASFGVSARLASGTIEGNLLMDHFRAGTNVSGGSLAQPATVLVKANRATGNGEHGLMNLAVAVLLPIDPGSNTVSLVPLQSTFDRNNPEDLREIPDTLAVTLSDNDSSSNVSFGIRLYAHAILAFGYQTLDATQPLTAGLTANVRGNTCTGNGEYGVAMEAGFPNRIDPRRLVVTFVGSFEGNSFAGNGRAAALFDFTRWDVSLGIQSPLVYKFVEGSTYQVTDIDGKLAGFDYDHPLMDPVSGTVLDNTFTVNGVEVPHGTSITPESAVSAGASIAR